MRTLIALLAVLQLTACVVILQSSITSTKVVSPIPSLTFPAVSYNTGPLANIAGPGVQWITGPPTISSSVTFESLFYASCTGNAKLKIFAFSSFEAFLDGISIAKGNFADGFKQEGFNVKINCGSHNLTVKVSGTPVAQEVLTFSLDQDQSACFNCGSTGFWNDQTCKCDCINRLDTLNDCKCPAPRFWRDFPTCGCVCPVKLCLPPKYFNPTLCECACRPTYCGPKQYFDNLKCACYDYIY